jgi:NAD(P)-dependent dehydrogenase (short-subunit alcohol dehydrogenase family)
MTKRHVVITGASRGIGRAAWDIFAKNDWFVIGIGRSPMGGDIPELGYFIQADVSYEKDWQKIKKETSDITDQLDAIVNNAAIQITKPILDTTVEEWDQVLNANLRSVFLSVKMMHPLLKAGNGGAIVNISSVHAVATSKEIAAYAASKGGMLALTRALAIELAPDNIRVNTVLPGAVDTEMLKAGLNRDHAGGGSAAQRLEKEIARAIYFLADNDQSSFITGQPLVIDGGATARLSTE